MALVPSRPGTRTVYMLSAPLTLTSHLNITQQTYFFILSSLKTKYSEAFFQLLFEQTKLLEQKIA